MTFKYFSHLLCGFPFSFRVVNQNNAGDSAVERERDAWVEVGNFVNVDLGDIFTYPDEDHWKFQGLGGTSVFRGKYKS